MSKADSSSTAWFIYTLKDPQSGLVRYVGATTNPERRYHQHMVGERQGKKLSKWVRQLKRGNQQPTMDIIEKTNGSKWEEREIYWIRQYRNRLGRQLLNQHFGGAYRPHTDSSGKQASRIPPPRSGPR